MLLNLSRQNVSEFVRLTFHYNIPRFNKNIVI
jgi:hypothetical protein